IAISGLELAFGMGRKARVRHSRPHTKPLPARSLVSVILTKRDLEILEALTKRVRVFSLQQIARTWWSGSANSGRVAENRLRILAAEDLLQIERAPAHPELEFEEPAASWCPGEPPPNFDSLSYHLQTRWRSHPARTPCISASKTAANRLGGYGGRPPRTIER